MSIPYISALLLLALVGCTGEADDRPGTQTAAVPTSAASATGRTPSHMEQEVGGGGMIHQMRAHMQAMQAASGEEAKARLPAHGELVETMLAEMGREVERGNARSDPAWTATADSVRRDLTAMSEMPAGALENFLSEHGRRLNRLMDLHRAALIN
jgi:hypothetical protein